MRFAFRDMQYAGLFYFRFCILDYPNKTFLVIRLAYRKGMYFRRSKKLLGGFILREAVVKSYEELPLFLNAQMIANVLGISISSAYELLHEEGFPSLRIGNRVVVPKDHFRQWVEDHIGK